MTRKAQEEETAPAANSRPARRRGWPSHTPELKCPTKLSILTKTRAGSGRFEKNVKRWGGGRRNFLRKFLPPSPNPTPLSSKIFTFIESLFAAFPETGFWGEATEFKGRFFPTVEWNHRAKRKRFRIRYKPGAEPFPFGF